MNRYISVFIAMSYLITAYSSDGLETTFHIAGFLVLPMACIWFSDAMGSFKGLFGIQPVINKSSPGSIVAFCGWLLLLLPAFIFLFSYVFGSS